MVHREPGLAQLLHWRPVPGFEPSPQTFAPGVEDMRQVREEFGEAVRRRELAPRADSDDAVRLHTVVLSGVMSQRSATSRACHLPAPGARDAASRPGRAHRRLAPPAVVWGIVSDVTRTPELSPEISSWRWLRSTTGPAVGARFEAGWCEPASGMDQRHQEQLDRQACRDR